LLASVAGLLALGLSTIGIAPAQADDATTGATISGVVTLDGTATGGLSVCGYSPDASAGCVTTAADGSYQLAYAISTSTTLASAWVSPSGKADAFPLTSYPRYSRAPSSFFNLAPGDALQAMDISVSSYPLVKGMVANKSGAPIVGATVDGGVQAVSSDSTGAYEVRVRTEYDGGRITAAASGYAEGSLLVGPDGTPSAANANIVLNVVATKITTAKPTISGKAKVGRTLKVHAGAWGPVGVQLSYQWSRNGKVIKSATAQTYKLIKKDRSKKITVKVTGSADGYTSVTVKSKATKKVAKR